MDVETAFLNEEQDEENFKEQAVGWVGKSHPEPVWKLPIGCYELKEESWKWYA